MSRLFTCISLITALGCAAVLQLTPGGQQVTLVTAPPPNLNDEWIEIQVLSCARGGNARRPATNIVQCQNELRNRTWDLGGRLVVVTSQQLGTTGPFGSGCPNCVTLIGTAYRRK
jgi:hypothetical protein